MPSKQRYQFQWFWDTCFHIFILCALGEVELAKRNMRSLFRQQEDNGFVGHMVFWRQVLPNRITDVLQARPTLQTLRPHMSALVQPPLIAQALKRFYEVSGDKLFVYELLPKIVQYHDWLAQNRDFDGDGLMTICAAILRLMYDDETAAFYDIRGGTNVPLKVLTAMSLFPLLLPEMPEDMAREIVSRHFSNPDEFASPYPIPSVAMSERSFYAKETFALWRGPTWPVINWFLFRCLSTKGFDREASNLYRATVNLIERSGFREYYNPFTGEGYGAEGFTWSGLVVDMDRTTTDPTWSYFASA
jgi:glycogen debranching enzyme